jgi:AcrR family transcriptional regulator
MVRELSPDKREKFLNIAKQLFAANGIQNTSTAEIARKAGTAAGTLFLYFPTKQVLIDELAILISQKIADTVNHQIDPSMSAFDMFRVIWNASIHWLCENMDAHQFSQQVREAGYISEEAAIKTGMIFRFYYDAIHKGLTEGSIKDYPADLVGAFLYQGIVAVMNYIRMQPVTTKRDESIQQGFDIFWDGIRIEGSKKE